jgi:hypothetical protein
MTALLLRSRRLLAALVLSLGVTVAMAGATPASAANVDPSSSPSSERARSYFGAISIGLRDAAAGWSYNYRTKYRAKRAAQRACKRRSDYPGRCRSVVWVRNGCAAVSVKVRSNGSVARYGWAVRRYKRPAIRAAQQKCGRRCVKRAWVCTARP